MINQSQPAAAPDDPFLRALAELQSTLAELQMPEAQADEGMNALAGMQSSPQAMPPAQNALSQILGR